MQGKILIATVKDLSELQTISIETFRDTFATENDPTDLQKYA